MEKLRKITGYSLLFVSCIAYGVIPIVPFMSLEADVKTAWVAGVFIFAQITWWVAVLLLGKEFVDWSKRIWRGFKAWFKSS